MEDAVTIRESVREFLQDFGMSRSQSRTVCPVCGPDRRKSNDKSLSVKVDGSTAIYKCHHCDVSGAVDLSPEQVPPSQPTSIHDLSASQYAYLLDRGISSETANRCGLVNGQIFINKRGAEVPCIGWVYRNADGSTATKWRDGAKNFSQTGAARSLWRIDDWDEGDLIICEGEMDATSFVEAGYFATSVPNGAPSAKVADPDSKKFSYLWDAKEILKRAERILIATDQDEPGRLLADEISRRVGKARCWRVTFPEECNDANDVLVKFGVDVLKDVVSAATPWPVSGLRDVSAFREQTIDLFREGMDRGTGVGFPALDSLFKANPQTLTVCTGIPGSGKSAFLTWMSVQLALQSNWNCAVFSAETSSQIHLLQMAAIYHSMPFDGPGKMSEDELNEALDWISTRFVFLDETDTDISSVIERAEAAVLRNGVRLLIVDPYNFLTGVEEGVAGINRLLVALKTFAVSYGVCVWLVAHPIKMYPDQSGNVPTPTGYSVSGSSGFFNTGDAGISLTRQDYGKTKLTTWKIRFPWLGSIGELTMDFDHRSGVFSPAIEGGNEDIDFDEF